MIILTLRTDKPEAELGLYSDETQVQYVSWQAHRQLAETIHTKINDLLQQNNYSLHDVNGIVIFEGPGSFTGLRIGMSVANALAAGLNVPVVGTGSDDWVQAGLAQLQKNNHGSPKYAAPVYGGEVLTTKQKK